MVAACAYCQSFIALREPFEDPTVTHGACDPCVERMLREWEVLTGPMAREPGGAADRVTGALGPASTPPALAVR